MKAIEILELLGRIAIGRDFANIRLSALEHERIREAIAEYKELESHLQFQIETLKSITSNIDYKSGCIQGRIDAYADIQKIIRGDR